MRKTYILFFTSFMLLVACEHSKKTTPQKSVLPAQVETVAKKDIKKKSEKKKVLNEKNVWSDFVKNPDGKNYEKCDRQLEKEVTDFHKKHPFECKPDATGECPDSVSYTIEHLFAAWENGNYWGFMNLVAKGNKYAMRLAFKMYPITDGSVIADTNAAIARSIVHNPELFLILMKQYQPEYPTLDLKDEFLFHYYEEDYDKTQKMMDQRSKIVFNQMIKALKRIKKSGLRSVRDQCVEKLREMKKQIKADQTEQ